MKKILFIFHKISYGGANKMLAFVANTLAKKGFEVFIYTYEGNEEPNYKLDENIKLIKEMKYYKRSNKNKIFQLGQTIKHINALKPNLVISFMSTSNFFAVIGAKLSRVPVIVCERGNPFVEISTLSKIKKVVVNFAEGIVFQTNGAKEYYSDKIQNRSTVIPNPVRKTKIFVEKWSERKNKIAFVGRHEIINKRQDLLVEAFKNVVEIYPNYSLHIYGDGDDEMKIRALVKKLSLEDKVIFEGKKDDILNEIKDSKLFVLTSDNEGIPNALAEAMSIGLPCISTDCTAGGARLLIEDGNNGLLVKKGDSIAISNAIISLIENPALCEKLGVNAKKIVEKFSEEKIAEKWVIYINKIIENHKEEQC